MSSLGFVYTTERALKAAFPGDTASGLDLRCGPIYDLNSPALAKHRRNGGADRDAYAAAIEAAIHQANNAWWKRGPSDNPKPYSGAQRRAQLNAELLNYPAKVRRARTEAEWKTLYEEAMKEKRLLNSTTTAETAAAFLKVRNSSLLIKDFPTCTSNLHSSSSAKTATPSRNSAARDKKQIEASSASSTSSMKSRSRSTSTGLKASSTSGAIQTAARKVSATSGAIPADIAAKRSAAAFKAHETRRRMKAEAEARR